MKRVVHAMLVPLGVSVFLAGVWVFCYAFQNSVVTKEQFSAISGAWNCTLGVGGVLLAVGGFALAFNSIFELMEKR